MAGLHVPTKAERVARFQAETVHSALEITGVHLVTKSCAHSKVDIISLVLSPYFTGALGYESASEITGRDIIRRTPEHGLRNFEEMYPWTTIPPGSLIDRTAPAVMQASFQSLKS